ncbi:MAG TPA: hypothetical protein VG845_01050 [Dehalococcoidia bacterium]|nr:hypothetical protein [Dehalococcoidia bacterium]
MRQHAARQKVPELLLHEGRQRNAVRLPSGRLEEGVAGQAVASAESDRSD